MAIQGIKISDLSQVLSVSGCSLFPVVQDGSTVSSKLSALGCSLTDFQNVNVCSLNINTQAGDSIDANCNISTDRSVIAGLDVIGQVLSSGNGTDYVLIQNGGIEATGSLSGHNIKSEGYVFASTNLLSTGNTNVLDVIENYVAAGVGSADLQHVTTCGNTTTNVISSNNDICGERIFECMYA